MFILRNMVDNLFRGGLSAECALPPLTGSGQFFTRQTFPLPFDHAAFEDNIVSKSSVIAKIKMSKFSIDYYFQLIQLSIHVYS